MNADDMVTGPDGRTYRVLGARDRNEGTRIVEVVELLAVDREPVARQTVADVLPALVRIGASAGLLDWLRERPAVTWQEAWDTCERGDLLAWLVMRLAVDNGSPSHRRVVGCLVEIVYALAWPWLHDQDEFAIAGPVRQCLDGLARYADGEDVDMGPLPGKARAASAVASSPVPVWRAASAAWYATVAAVSAEPALGRTAAVWYATVAATVAAAEPADIAWRAWRAAETVRSGADASLAAVDLDARSAALRCAAEIVRAHYPAAPEIGGAP